MGFAILAFVAGVLTVAAPCILPLLPIIVGGSLSNDKDAKQDLLRPLIVSLSLAVSVVVFSLLLKASTLALGIPAKFWQTVSATIIVLLGVNYLYPRAWERIAVKFNLASNRLLGKAHQKRGFVGAIFTGLALGPVFNSCSPTYAFIVAAILPTTFSKGLIYLICYATGLSLTLLLVAIIGQSLTRKLGWLNNPHGAFVKILGILFLVVGISIFFGLDKKLQTYVLERGWYDPVSRLEERLN